MPQATYDDVTLVLRLYELRREERLRQAREWFVKNFKVKTLDEFNKLCPPGSDENTWARMVVSHWDMAASFVTAGVLNVELFFQSAGELLLVWERMRDFLPESRDANKNPNAWKNLEIVGNQFIELMKKNGPGAYEAFSARVRS